MENSKWTKRSVLRPKITNLMFPSLKETTDRSERKGIFWYVTYQFHYSRKTRLCVNPLPKSFGEKSNPAKLKKDRWNAVRSSTLLRYPFSRGWHKNGRQRRKRCYHARKKLRATSLRKLFVADGHKKGGRIVGSTEYTRKNPNGLFLDDPPMCFFKVLTTPDPDLSIRNNIIKRLEVGGSGVALLRLASIFRSWTSGNSKLLGAGCLEDNLIFLPVS